MRTRNATDVAMPVRTDPLLEPEDTDTMGESPETEENPPPRYVVRWDVQGIVSKFGGIAGLVVACRDTGFAVPQPRTVEAWITRRSIPSHWLAVLLAVMWRRDPEFNFIQVLTAEISPHGGTHPPPLS